MTNIANWVEQETTTTGTGPVTVSGSINGSATLVQAFGTGVTSIRYSIESGDNRESGIGSFDGTSGIFTRTTVGATLVSGVYDDTSPAAISLTGTSIVRCTLNAETFLSSAEFPTYAVFDAKVAGGAAIDFVTGNKQVVDAAVNAAVTVTSPTGHPGNFVLKILNSASLTSLASATEGGIQWDSGTAPSWTGKSTVFLYYDGSEWEGSANVGLAV